MGLVVEQERPTRARSNQRLVEPGQRVAEHIGGLRVGRLIRRLDPDSSDAELARPDIAPPTLDYLTERGESVAAADQGRAIGADRFGQAHIVAMALTELPIKAQPTRPLAARRKL